MNKIQYSQINGSYTKEPTGFLYNSDINISYNKTTRKITLTGSNLTAVYKGKIIKELHNKTTWESIAHADTDGVFYLKYGESGFVFSTTQWSYSDVQISVVQRNTPGNYAIGLREAHGLMQHLVHEVLHGTIGSYLISGGDVTGLVSNSTVASERRPIMSQAIIKDEDYGSLLSSISSNYTQRFISGTTSQNTKSYSLDNADIINLTGNRPNYNSISGSNWGWTPFPTNAYGKIFIVAVPTTSDTESSKYRMLFVQPQTASTNLSTIQALTPSSLVHGESGTLFQEFVFIGEIIIRYTGSNWVIISSSKLTGTKVQQVSSPSLPYLTQVYRDDSLKGDGTTISPLGFNKLLDNTGTASSTTEGSMRYRTDANNSYIDVCMKTSATTYEWVNIVTNTWS
jgi:hypothetical protein